MPSTHLKDARTSTYPRQNIAPGWIGVFALLRLLVKVWMRKADWYRTTSLSRAAFHTHC